MMELYSQCLDSLKFVRKRADNGNDTETIIKRLYSMMIKCFFEGCETF